jgi:uncharacterized membrane protein YccC
MTWTAILQIIARFWQPIAALLGGLLAYLKGRADANAQAARKEMQANIETRKRADEAEAEIVGDDPDAASEWLRERGERDRRL